MKRTIYILLISVAMLAIRHGAYGQKHDRHWMGQNWYFDGTEILMRFDEDTITYHTINLPEKIHISTGILAISNAEGELQFYTNGNVVVSHAHKVMSGGKGFNEGSPYDDFLYDPPWFPGPDTTYNVNYAPYTYQVIPDAEDENIYYMVHAFIAGGGGCMYFDVPKMQISKIDMSANGERAGWSIRTDPSTKNR